ncbi:MAG: NgoBV family restriction endonuclease [Clostridium sp.]|nr:NgoBV family restriction endonuclease [Clostridium sp.]MCM1172822.1 NgoBV family restriction endonuclease [Clostridium sp.]MCM1208057.1 NgoBV family restriction endonuclease [Ruminococcus sp.]
MKLTAQDVYEKLVNDDKILTLKGQIKFFLGDVDIIVKQRDVVGNIMQEWLQGWLDARGIEYAPSENTQMPPDFFLNPDDLTKNLLEVKAFNRDAGPGFDIADFRMYQKEIIKKPYMLDVEYLIFGYDMSKDGIVTIKDIWLKKVWEITRRMKDWPINLQIKEKVVHKIRPGIWYNGNSGDYAIFECMEDFISAMEETVYQNKDTRDNASTWLMRFKESYKREKGIDLIIPRWYEIAAKYDLKVKRLIGKVEQDIEKYQEQIERYSKKLSKMQTDYNLLKADKTIEKQIEIENCEKRITDITVKLNDKKEELKKLKG